MNKFAEDVRRGLTSNPKSLPPKYFYDALGSRLFEAICLLPEYYLTRAETEIFERHAAEIVAQLPGPTGMVELGSGSSIKTRLLIEAILSSQDRLHYQPVDISATMLEESAGKLLNDYPGLSITAHAGDYTAGLGSIVRRNGEKLLVLFLGSNIGNYPPDEARGLLQEIRGALQSEDGLLLGADLKKSPAWLLPAYNDAIGVTAAFNLNLLLRINRELEGNFDPTSFEHRAIYHELSGRIEMHLVSRVAQKVCLQGLGLEVDFQAGETIHTESSYKYDLSQLESLAQASGFQPAQTWLDSQARFSCNFWRASG